MKPQKVAILGSTGSIGENTLDVVAQFPEKIDVVALAAGRNWERLVEQARRFRPEIVSVADDADAARVEDALSTEVKVLSGEEGLREVAAGAGAGLVVSALVGAAGLPPTLAAIDVGASIALANKEVLVMAGELVTSRVSAGEVELLPVDSEHAGVAQALAGRPKSQVERIVLTASGGPFRNHSVEAMKKVCLEEALNHPNWKMGPKITIDSASMMNKGLEIIEARWLFGLKPEQVDVLVHPQSIVHAMVEFVDGSYVAQMSMPDMRIPIAQAIFSPERLPIEAPRLDLGQIGSLTFEAPDPERFPCLTHAKDAMSEGGTAPVVLNAANEIAVASFLSGASKFMDIPDVVGAALQAHEKMNANDLETILEADRWAREYASSRLNGTVTSQ
ncbi:MAG: 1-deoxy-D-xylulose-5-phosphate reductoisomerase [Nitrospinae bacterium]|nr:1-deoxy-D-xylulose-5-phosphate reductoisomerase [Nitrospinota bacterium]